MTSITGPGPVGFCIYCGASDRELSNEHVVPFALGGTTVLMKSSCEACAMITAQFEQFVARTMLGPFRIWSDAPTRRPTERPTELSLGLIDEDGTQRKVVLPAGEHPSTMMLPVFAEPRLLTLPSDERRETFIMWFAFPLSKLDMSDLLKRHGASAVQIGTFEILKFSRLLAKIAHSAAYYLLSGWTELFEPLLVDLILGESKEHDTLVGGNDKAQNAPVGMSFPLHFESIDIGEARYLVAVCRLYANNRVPDSKSDATDANSGPPVYRIVVGKKR